MTIGAGSAPPGGPRRRRRGRGRGPGRTRPRPAGRPRRRRWRCRRATRRRATAAAARRDERHRAGRAVGPRAPPSRAAAASARSASRDARVLLGERGQDAVADARAREARVGVRRILDERDAAPPEVAQDLARASRRAAGARTTSRRYGMPARPRDAGAADDAIEDGLGLVVGLVAERHPVARRARGASVVERRAGARRARRPAARRPRRRAVPPRRRPPRPTNGSPSASRALAHQLQLSRARVGAQAVVDGGDLQREAQPRAQLPQRVQQRHRIGTARDGDDHAVARDAAARASAMVARTVDNMSNRRA